MPEIGRERIAALVPHAGAMCLLERVLRWDAESLEAESLSHRDPGNPLRRGGLLPAVCGLEYALQAMALHGALGAAGGATAQPAGMVSSLREVAVAASRLDDVAGPLAVSVRVLGAESRGFLYRFAVHGGGRELLSGRAAVILPAAG